MMITFFPRVYNFSIDGEKLFLQFLLVTFALSFIYFACRSMRIVEKQYNKTSKKITQLRARMDVVLAHHEPVCHNVLYHSVVRYRHSLVAGYLKDLLNEKQFEPEKFSNFFKDFPKTSSNKQNFSYSTGPSENVDSITNINTKKASGKESPSEVRGRNELISSQQKNITRSHYHSEENKAKEGRKNGFKVVKSPLESKIFKTLEGPNRRLRSSIFEKRKSKLPRWNVMGLKNVHDRCNENLTVYTALTSTKSPFKVKSHAKSPSQKTHLALKISNVKYPENFNSNVPSVMGDEKMPRENENQVRHFGNVKSVKEVANVSEARYMHSVENSGCESDGDSDPNNDQCSQVSFNDGKVRQNTPLTTINEESAEENCPSE